MKFIDLTGRRFNSLKVIERAPSKNKHVYWLCLCDCGNKTTVMESHLKNDHTISCGCLKPYLVRMSLKRRTRDAYGGFNRDDVG